MSSTVSTTVGAGVVVTQVHQAPQGTERQRYVDIQKFMKAWPLALGYIAAGSLTVAAGKSVNRCLVNSTLALCVIAAVASCIATILYSLDVAGILRNFCYYYDHESGRYWCSLYLIRMQGFSGVLAVFHFLEFIVSITVSGFACCAACNCNSQPPPGNVAMTPYAPPSVQAPLFSAPPTGQVPYFTKSPEGLRAAAPTEPPAYNAVIN